jgi:hypothetical protein
LPQLPWVDPENIAGDLRMEVKRIDLLRKTRSDMPPEAEGWVAELDRIAGGLSVYAESLRRQACEQLSASIQVREGDIAAHPGNDGPWPPILEGDDDLLEGERLR